LLGNFIREDLALRREISIKQNWIKNSAHLSAGAPWILLLLLSTQSSTVEAFSNTSGIMILFLGLLMTSVAYLWMNRLGRIPQQTRIFAGQ
jgi:tight adherence protein B